MKAFILRFVLGVGFGLGVGLLAALIWARLPIKETAPGMISGAVIGGLTGILVALLVPPLSKKKEDEWVYLLRLVLRRLSASYMYPALVMLLLVVVVLMILAERALSLTDCAMIAILAAAGLVFCLLILWKESDYRYITDQLIRIRMEIDELKRVARQISQDYRVPPLLEACIVHTWRQEGIDVPALASRLAYPQQRIKKLISTAIKYRSWVNASGV